MQKVVIVFLVVIFTFFTSAVESLAFVAPLPEDFGSKAGSYFFSGGINTFVFRKAEAFLREKFPVCKVNKKNHWEAYQLGFVLKVEGNGNCDIAMRLFWNGYYVVQVGTFNKEAYSGDWVDWVK